MIKPLSGLNKMVGSWLDEAESLTAELFQFVSEIDGEDRAEISAPLIPADHSGKFQENPMANPNGLFSLFGEPRFGGLESMVSNQEREQDAGVDVGLKADHASSRISRTISTAVRLGAECDACSCLNRSAQVDGSCWLMGWLLRTSLATACPRLVMSTSSPASTASNKADNWAFASARPTVLMVSWSCIRPILAG